MAEITIQVLEGLERGRVFESLETPVTIGREDDNTIQLNDERISRFHSKIQEDGERIILTDLDSTNGTRVNGRPVQLRVIQPGDQVAIGRCLLVFGSSTEIAEHLGINPHRTQQDTTPDIGSAAGATINLQPHCDDELDLIELFPSGPPELPTQLTALQQAQLSDLVSFIHDRIGSILRDARSPGPADELQRSAEPEIEGGLESLIEVTPEVSTEGPGNQMLVAAETWQRLLALEMELALYLRSIAEPSESADSNG
jgi:predicted component of type VI protein secretion system